MLRLHRGVVGNYLFLLLLVTCLVHPALAQLETATVLGQVVDPSGLSVAGAHVKLVDIDRDTSTTATTNNSGLYTFASVHPGRYRMEVNAAGFRIVNVTGLTLYVQDHVEQNFRLQIGSVAESVTVEASAQQVNTTDATVSTVVDRQFAENLPMNGRSFQTLIELTPGVVVTASNGFDAGQFSVDGQRSNSNYWMVDGVGANIGISTNVGPGSGIGGSLGSFSVLGGTNSLVSVDAMQEFRIQTSTYAPEFGRTPGAQISIETRGGTNQFHGTVFDYLRNDVLDANNWFADNSGLAKPKERQNDFGGTFAGPILKDRTFFFFSYEGFRLRLPETVLSTVPDLTVRQNAIPAMQPFLNAYPTPNGPDDVANGAAQFNASFSNPASLDAYSLRIDHRIHSNVMLFARYNYSPSELDQRGIAALNNVLSSRITTQTATLGTTWMTSAALTNDIRFNYSSTKGGSDWHLDDFGGATPLTAPFPSPFTSQNSQFGFTIYSLTDGEYLLGRSSQNMQRQINVVENTSIQVRSHTLKFGVDYRRLSPYYHPFLYGQSAFFSGMSSAEAGNADYGVSLQSAENVTLLFRNLGVFAQDTWRVVPRLTLTYGIRWDVDFVPRTLNGPSIPAVTGYDLSNLASLALAPAGTPPFQATYNNIAPRVGVAYEISQKPDWGTVLRGGFGSFYDLADGELGNLLGSLDSYPFGGFNLLYGSFPLNPTSAQPPPITPANLGPPFGSLGAFDPQLKLPYTLEWNVALEEGLGKQQALSLSYVGAVGKRLIQSAFVLSPNQNLGSAVLIGNTAKSDYNALQVQFKRRLSRGLQGLASYTWSHSIDTASAGSVFGNGANGFASGLNADINRGASDFDIRNAFSAGVTYEFPTTKINEFANAISRGWSIENSVLARSAVPLNVYEGTITELNMFSTQVRPDIVPGIPIYLYGSQYPGGKALNNTAGAVVGGCPDGSQSIGPFCPPPTQNGSPVRQGDFGRNGLRSFGAWQWDLAVHRDFPIHEALKAQFRAELFNALNHPNFGPLQGALGYPTFGQSTATLAQSLGGSNVGSGGFSPLYQFGGPRSIQLALKLMF
jgi:hypothetical protein